MDPPPLPPDTTASHPEGYPAGWAGDTVLADGSVLHLRPVRPDDIDRFRDLAGRLSAESLYYRFFSPMPRISDERLRHFTTVDYGDRMAFVGERAGRVVAVGRYERTAPDRAEVAFVVEDYLQHRGIGMLLLEHLAAYAHEQGIERFEAETLGDNRKMLEVFAHAGFPTERALEDGIWHLDLPVWPLPGASISERERHAEATSIRRILAPGAVAVIGAGREPGGLGHDVVRNLVAGGFTGRVVPVNPHAGEIAGLPAVASVVEIDPAPDIAVITVPAATVPEVVAECGEAGVHALVILSAGFADAGPDGRRLQDEVVVAAHRLGMRVVGPNCMGIVNTDPAVRLHATFAPVAPVPGRVGFLSQSGVLGITMLARAAERGIGISSFVSVGNKADVSGNDLLQHWYDDPCTDVVALHLESFGNPRKFSRIARELAQRKPIVALKSGRWEPPEPEPDETGREGPAAGLAASDRTVDALFQQAGVIRVETLEELFDVARLLTDQPLPAGPRVALVGNRSGPLRVAADAARSRGLEVVALSPATRARITEAAPAVVRSANPVDLGADAGPDAYAGATAAVLDDDGVDAVIVLFASPRAADPAPVGDAVARVAAGSGKPVAANVLVPGHAVTTFGPSPGRDGGEAEAAIPAFAYPETPAFALARAARLGLWRRRPAGTVPDPRPGELDAVRAELEVLRPAIPAGPRAPGHGRWLGVEASRRLLQRAGVAVIPGEVVSDVAGAMAAAESLGGSVSLHALIGGEPAAPGAGVTYRDLRSVAAVQAAWSALAGRLGDELGEVLVQREAPGTVALAIGVHDDPLFGPVVTAGPAGAPGGDRSLRLVPVSDVDALELVTESGVDCAGAGAGGAAALGEALVALGRLAASFPEVAAVEIDPVLVGPGHAGASLARVRLAPVVPPDSTGLRWLDR